MSKTDTTPKAWQTAPKLGQFNPGELKEMAEAIHYPEHWDTACYPTLADAIYEIVTNAGCSECPKKQ